MALNEELIIDVNGILNQAWDVRDGTVVPTVDTVLLAGGSVKLNATILYSDLADSTELALYNRQMSAKIFKAFLHCVTKIIRSQGGDVRSFDGDRVMAVFLGDYKNTSAVKCALKINSAFKNIIKPKLEAKYEVLRNGTYKLAHCTGIDTSDVMVVRAGIRNHNDLVWVGRAPNIAAKLSSIRNDPYFSYITQEVFNKLNDEAKISNGKAMWEKRENTWKEVLVLI